MLAVQFGGLIPPVVEAFARDGLFQLACVTIADALHGGVDGLNGGAALLVSARKNALNEAFAVLGAFCNEQLEYVTQSMCDCPQALVAMARYVEDCNESLGINVATNYRKLEEESCCDDVSKASADYPDLDWARLAIRVSGSTLEIMERGGAHTLDVRKRLAGVLGTTGMLRATIHLLMRRVH